MAALMAILKLPSRAIVKEGRVGVVSGRPLYKMRTLFWATVSPAPKQAEKLPSAAVERIWNWPKVSGDKVTQPERETLPLVATAKVALADAEPEASWLKTPPLTVPVMVRPFCVNVTVAPRAMLATARPLRFSVSAVVPVRLKVPSLLNVPLSATVSVANPGKTIEPAAIVRLPVPELDWDRTNEAFWST